MPLFFYPCFVFECTYNIMDMFPGVVRLQVIRDGIPQLVSTVPLTDWYDTAVRTAVSCLFVFSHRDSPCYYSLFSDHRQDFRGVSRCDNIFIIHHHVRCRAGSEWHGRSNLGNTSHGSRRVHGPHPATWATYITQIRILSALGGLLLRGTIANRTQCC